MKALIKTKITISKTILVSVSLLLSGVCLCFGVFVGVDVSVCVFRIVRQLSLNAMAMMVILFPIKLAMIG